MSVVYKLVAGSQWREAEHVGVFTGSPVDAADGFIHFSTAAQVKETAVRHFSGQQDLLLVAVSAEHVGDGLRWERSRGGALFPHLYGRLEMGAVLWVKQLPLGADGRHEFPPLEPDARA